MSQIADLTVAILAGGKSTRFGCPKMYAYFRGKPLIQHCIENSLKISNSIHLITGKKNQLFFNSIKSYPDLLPELGPLGGIYTALETAKTPLIAIMPGDMPILQPDTYRKLYSNSNDHQPIAVLYQGWIQPLVSIWPKKLSKHLKYIILDGQTHVQKVLRKLEMLKYTITSESQEFLNINTKEDYQLLLKNPHVDFHANG
jgi:molybdopterin-guanine dinucleotide biosynthesis protein A